MKILKRGSYSVPKITIAFLLFLFSVNLWSDELSIIVNDKDLDIPLEGVRLTGEGVELFTDFEGKAVIPVPPETDRFVLTAALVGYESKRILVKDFSTPLEIEMLIEGVMEGAELVVEAEAIGETDEKVGSSLVVEQEQIANTAKIGVVEDVISAVKVLPGVSFTGGFNSQVSVRGGYPDDMTYLLDGFIVKYPYHWGGGFSIFNPNIVQSIKFSSGVFPARYGNAASGMLEVNTVKPNEGLKFSFIQSTTTSELFLQVPLDSEKKSGILLGGRATYFDLVIPLMKGLLDEFGTSFSRIPYLYDFYAKGYYRPGDRFNVYLNGFFGFDGIGISAVNPNAKDDEIKRDFNLYSEHLDLIVNLGFDWLLADKVLFKGSAGYERWRNTYNLSFSDKGIQEYSDEFIANWGSAIPLLGWPGLGGATEYTIDNKSENSGEIIKDSIQGRFDFDFTVSEQITLSTGAGGIFDWSTTKQHNNVWVIQFEGTTPEYRQIGYKPNPTQGGVLSSFLYLDFNIILIPEQLDLNLGARGDHVFFWGKDNFTLNTYPTPSPRASLTWTLPQKGELFKKTSINAGVGLFTKVPLYAIGIDKQYGIKDFEIKTPKTFMGLLGWESEFPYDMRFRLEGYYKHLFDQFYDNLSAAMGSFHSDGIGNAAGFDLILERRSSRYWDAMFTYSFIYAKYLFPEDDGTDSSYRGQWIFPNFHRFHTINFLLNLKPTQNITITTKATFASGLRATDYGEKKNFPAVMDNGEIIELYTRKTEYNDTKRDGFRLPVDVKFAWHNYFPGSKVRYEFYVGVQDLLAPLMHYLGPKSENVQTNPFTGEEENPPVAGLNFPIPSVGMKLSY